MSGSPIYVDGKLVGALAYGWPFSKEPDLRDHADPEHARHPPRAAARRRFRSGLGLGRLDGRRSLSAFSTGQLRRDASTELVKPFRGRLLGRSDGRPLPIPVSFGGRLRAGPAVHAHRRAANWMSVPSGERAASSAGGGPPARPLQPGSAVADAASVGRHGSLRHGNGDVGRGELGPRPSATPSLDGPGRHADGAGRTC